MQLSVPNRYRQTTLIGRSCTLGESLILLNPFRMRRWLSLLTGPTRVGARSALLVIIVLLVLHTSFLLVIRTGVLLNVTDSQDVKRSVETNSGQSVTNKDLNERARFRTNISKEDLGNPIQDISVYQAAQAGRRKKLETGKRSQGGAFDDEIPEHAPVIKAAQSAKSSYTKKKDCIRYISIYTPRAAPFNYWREYVEIKEAFDNANNEKITQRKEFPTIYVECPGYRCDVAVRPTADAKFLSRSDAIILNMAPHEVKQKMPAISKKFAADLPRRVKLFFYAMESPLMMNFWDSTIKDVSYHYTMTYHSMSDAWIPYGRYVPGTPIDKEPIDFTEGKTKLIAWMASNCLNTFWPRIEFVKELQRYIPIDTYGKCGNLTCLPALSPNCTRLLQPYKFYLALENAACDEYISEKFWDNCLKQGVVPVVYGGRREAYERVAPPNSFIHISDFASIKDLAEYLLLLDKNDEMYNSYFKWRLEGTVEKVYPNLHPRSFCNILPKISKYSKPPVHLAHESKYYQSCRATFNRTFFKEGDINTWTPWR